VSVARPNTWMPIYWGDYDKDTGDLGALEHGAYLMLIKHYWCKAAPLPMDHVKLARIACCTPAEWSRIKGTVLGFFEEGESVYRHGRIDRELEKAQSKYEKRSNARANFKRNPRPKLDINPGTQSPSQSTIVDRAQAPDERIASRFLKRRPSEVERALAAKATGSVPWECSDADVEHWQRILDKRAGRVAQQPEPAAQVEPQPATPVTAEAKPDDELVMPEFLRRTA